MARTPQVLECLEAPKRPWGITYGSILGVDEHPVAAYFDVYQGFLGFDPQPNYRLHGRLQDRFSSFASFAAGRFAIAQLSCMVCATACRITASFVWSVWGLVSRETKMKPSMLGGGPYPKNIISSFRIFLARSDTRVCLKIGIRIPKMVGALLASL